MNFRGIRPLLASVVIVSLFPIIPAHALSSSLFPGSSQSLQVTDPGQIIYVDIPGSQPHLLSQDVLGAGLNPAAATQEDLLSAAVFSAEYEGNTVVRNAALNALSPERYVQVSAALSALHSPVPSPASLALDTPIVVLGNGLNNDGSVHPNLRNRLAAAMSLATERPNAPVVVTGGPTREGHVEAHSMQEWLIAHGLSTDRIIVEDRAGSTIENARFSRHLRPQTDSVIVVTSENHIQRSMVVFTLAFGAHTAGVGAPNGPPTGIPSHVWTYRDIMNWFLA